MKIFTYDTTFFRTFTDLVIVAIYKFICSKINYYKQFVKSNEILRAFESYFSHTKEYPDSNSRREGRKWVSLYETCYAKTRSCLIVRRWKIKERIKRSGGSPGTVPATRCGAGSPGSVRECLRSVDENIFHPVSFFHNKNSIKKRL